MDLQRPGQKKPEMTDKPDRQRLVLIFSILSVFYIFSMFYRVCNAVIAPSLTQDLSLDAEMLGVLGGAFFYSFALVQIPMGPMLDRMGPRIVLTAFSLIGALGACLFAVGNTYTAAVFGRILIGIGMSPLLMGALKIFLARFPLEKFSTLMGSYIAIGSLGNVLGASPLAYLNATLGWRKTFFLSGMVTALFAFLVFWVLREERTRNRRSHLASSDRPTMGVLPSIRLVLGSLSFWQIGAVSFFRYGTFMGLPGLWLGPYFMNIMGYSPMKTGQVLAVLALGTIAAGPTIGWFADRTGYSRKWLTLWGLSLYCATLFPLIGFLKMGNFYVYLPLFLVMGFANGFGMLVLPHATSLFPRAISGTVMTLTNFFPMSGAAIFMPLMGRLIGSFPRTGHVYPAQAYHVSFLICFLSMAASLIFYAFSKKDK